MFSPLSPILAWTRVTYTKEAYQMSAGEWLCKFGGVGITLLSRGTQKTGDGKEVRNETRKRRSTFAWFFRFFHFFHSIRRRAFDPRTPPSQYLISTGRCLVCLRRYSLSSCSDVQLPGRASCVLSQSVGSESFRWQSRVFLEVQRRSSNSSPTGFFNFEEKKKKNRENWSCQLFFSSSRSLIRPRSKKLLRAGVWTIFGLILVQHAQAIW